LMNKKIAVYAGSFDPFTFGHIDIARRASTIFDQVHIAIGTNPAKSYLFSFKERKYIIENTLSDLNNIVVDGFDGLLVDFCNRNNANIIIRGLRSQNDLSFEFPIGLANMDMAPHIETIFLLSKPENIFVSSSLIKEIAVNGGDVTSYVPQHVIQLLNKAFTKGNK